MLAVIVAVRAEQLAVNRHLDVLDERQLPGGYVVCQGTYKTRPVLTCRTGLGEERVKGILDEIIHQHSVSAIVSARMASGVPAGFEVGQLAFCPEILLWREEAGISRPSGQSDMRLLEMAGYAATKAGIEHRVGRCLTIAPLRPEPLDREELVKHDNLLTVDTDGYWVAEAAFEHDIPFLAVRASFGDVYDRIPQVIDMVGKRSYVSNWEILKRNVTRPHKLPDFLALADTVRKCCRSLHRFFGPFLEEWDRNSLPTADRSR